MTNAARLQRLFAGPLDEAEAMNYNKKMAVGTVSKKSTLSDPHIQKAIKYAAQATGKSVQDIEAHLQDKAKEFEDVRAKSPILYDSIAGNIFEQELYKYFREGKVKAPAGVDKFDPVTFSALVRRVKAENPSLFPLRNFYNKKPLAAPRMILVPTSNKVDEKWNKVDTAAATPNGEFIFNIDCCQRDMNFAYVQGIKPKSKKYKCNGGPFPDEWAPVEFTILHEFYHYTHGDFHYMKVMGGNPTIHNWAGDFRSNYDLIKAGYEPYAEGLFNDHINYDRQQTYKEMYDIVEREFKKLNKDQQQKVGQALGGMGDDHSEHESDAEPSHGETPGMEDLEGHGKKVSKKSGEAKDKDGAEPGKAGDEGKPQAKADKGGPGSRQQLEPRAVDWTQIRPRFDWKTLLAKLIRSADTTETTYQKVHRRNITSVHVATQTGAGVVRPGEKEVPANLVKLCIVIDSSGSMHEAIKKVFANIHALFNTSQSQIAKQFALVEFSGGHHIYNCTIAGKAGTAYPIHDVNGMKGGGGSAERVDLAVLLARHEGGGTNFDAELVSKLKGFAAQKYNILIMSDTDIVAGSNKDHFLDLYGAHHHQVYLLLDSRESFTHVVSALKQASANVSHL
jgi:hypothetical protein